MMSQVHAMLAKELYEHIYLMYGIRLKKNSLIYGSMEPDITTLFPKYPHYFDKSLDMLCERIEALKEAARIERGTTSRTFARELGVATHYIADFFCRVHNDINGVKHNEHLGHVVYEQKMSMKINQNYIDVIREKMFDSFKQELELIDTIKPKEYLLSNHDKYMEEAGKKSICSNKKRQYALDVEYATKMVLVIGSYIIKNV